MVGSISQTTPEDKEQQLEDSQLDFDSLNWTPDILGQNPFRLIYPTLSPLGAFSEDFETALKIAWEFDAITDYEDRMNFWDTHYTVFGLACTVVFDTQKEVYGWHHSYSQENLTYGLEGGEDHFRVFSILPANVLEFLPFMHWCLGKRRNKVEIQTIMDVNYFWKQFEKSHKSHNSDKFLTDVLSAAEAHSNSVNEVLNPWVSNSFTDVEAKKCFFFYGKQDAIYGETEGLFGSVARLDQVYRNIITCPLSTYGEIFFQYDDGYHTATMVGFLRGLKKRLDRGEKISVPAEQLSNPTGKEENQTVNNESATVSLSPLHQNFLDVVASIEASLGSIGQPINPTFYTPVATLWERLGDEDKLEVRELYRGEVKNQIDFATELSDFLVNEYHSAVKMQPDRHRELLIEHRDKYVNLLAEKFGPIKRWYVELEGEASKTLERVVQVETAVFSFLPPK